MCNLILEWTQISKFTCCLSPFWNYRWTTCPLLLSFMSIRSLPKWWETQGNTFIIWACPSRGQFVTTSTSKEEDCGACRSRQACISVNISTDLHENRAEQALYSIGSIMRQTQSVWGSINPFHFFSILSLFTPPRLPSNLKNYGSVEPQFIDKICRIFNEKVDTVCGTRCFVSALIKTDNGEKLAVLQRSGRKPQNLLGAVGICKRIKSGMVASIATLYRCMWGEEGDQKADVISV